MKELVEVIAKALVDNPDEVVVEETTEGKNVTVNLHVAATDMGKVIESREELPRQSVLSLRQQPPMTTRESM